MILALARLVRFPNLIIVALTQYLLYYCVFFPHFEKWDINPRMGLIHFSLLVLVTVVLTASGYVINDVMDIKADKINKPKTMVISRYISRRTALWLYFCLQAVGFFLSIYLSFHVENLRLLILYPTAAIGLYAYSSVLKRRPLFGHLLIAAYCAGVALVVWLSELPAFLSLSKIDPESAFYLKQITISYAIFAFLSTLLRELIKVLQDEQGDRQAAYQTTAIVWGQKKVKNLCLVLSIVLLLLLVISGFYFATHFNALNVSLMIFLLALPIVFIIHGLNRIGVTPNFKQLSRLTKLLMLLGVLVLLSFG